MKLVDHYVRAVGRHLPEDQRDDIMLDLREALDGELEAAADAAGAPLDERGEAEVLERFGHPLRVARRYHSPRSLIGPELYPDWWRTLKVAAVTVLALQVVAALVIASLTGWFAGPFELLGLSVNLLVWVFVVVTGVFIAIEFSGERFDGYGRWRAKSLLDDSVALARRGNLITDLVGEGVFLLWWNGVVRFQDWIPGLNEAFRIDLGAAWTPWYWPLNVLFACAFGVHLLVLARGVWQRWTVVVELGLNAALLGVIAALLWSGDLVSLSGAVANQLPGDPQAFADRVVSASLCVIAAFVAWDAWSAARLWSRRRATRQAPVGVDSV